MISKILMLCAVLVATTAEPPVSSGYNYPAPQNHHHHHHQHQQQQQQVLLPAVQAPQSSFQPQQQVSYQPQQQVSFQPQQQHHSSSSSQVLDGQLIGQIQNLIYQDEIRSIQQAYSGPSGQYGVPQIRVTGVALESARPSLEISQYSESAPSPTSYHTGSINLPAVQPAHSSGYNYPAPQVSTGSIQLPAVQPAVSSGYNYPAPHVQPAPAPAPVPIYKPAPAPVYQPAPAPVYQPAPAPTYQPAPAPVQHNVGQIISPSYQQSSSSGYNYPRPQPQQAPSAIYLPSHQHKPAPAPSTSYGVPY